MRYFCRPALLALLLSVSLEANTINVPPGASLQAALDAARPGDEIVLQPGATYTGPFTLGVKNGPDEILIRSAAISQMPAGTRVTPAAASLMPKLVSASDFVVRVLPGAGNYRLAGLEITPLPGRFLNDLVRIGSGQEQSIAEQPRNITIERSWLHGDPDVGSRRGVALNGVENAVVDSYFTDFKATDVDTQGVAGWSGAGPHLIRNNYIEAAAENIMFGGADPVIEGLIPSNITIEKNHLRKPESWKGRWLVKNLLQLKNAKHVVIDNNILEDVWKDGQAGYAVVMTPSNQDGRCPWAAVEDVRFTNNVVRRAVHGIFIRGRDATRPSGQTRLLTIRNNRFEEIPGLLFEFMYGVRDIVIEHNTGLQGAMAVSATGDPNMGLVFRNNLTMKDEGGILGYPPALSKYFPDAIVEHNAFIGGTASNYPANNFFPVSADGVAAELNVGVMPVPLEVEAPGIRVGYVVVTPDAGALSPLASSLIGRVQNGEVLSQTTVFPPEITNSAAMFVDVVPAIGRNMGLAVTNPNAVAISVTLRLIDAAGAPSGLSRVLTIQPHAQIARFINELFDTMPAAFTGTLEIESTGPAALMGFRFGGSSFSVLPVESTSDPSQTPAVIFPQFAIGEGWATQLMLLNRATSPIGGRVDVFDTNGNPMTVTLNGVSAVTFRYSIPAGGSLLLAPRYPNGQSPL